MATGFVMWSHDSTAERLHPREDQPKLSPSAPRKLSLSAERTPSDSHRCCFASVFMQHNLLAFVEVSAMKLHMHRKPAPGLFVFGLRFYPSSRREGSDGLNVPADIIQQLSESQACQQQSREALQPFNTHQTAFV